MGRFVAESKWTEKGGRGINVGGVVDFRINRRVSLGLDIRYHNASDALRGFEFVTTNFNVGIHFGA